MSEMEYNKGKLVPVTREEIEKEYPEADFCDLDWTTDGKYIVLNGGQCYEPVFDVQLLGDLDDLANVDVGVNGVIYFETYHYNGGGDWTELVEEELEKEHE